MNITAHRQSSLCDSNHFFSSSSPMGVPINNAFTTQNGLFFRGMNAPSSKRLISFKCRFPKVFDAPHRHNFLHPHILYSLCSETDQTNNSLGEIWETILWKNLLNFVIQRETMPLIAYLKKKVLHILQRHLVIVGNNLQVKFGCCLFQPSNQSPVLRSFWLVIVISRLVCLVINWQLQWQFCKQWLRLEKFSRILPSVSLINADRNTELSCWILYMFRSDGKWRHQRWRSHPQ